MTINIEQLNANIKAEDALYVAGDNLKLDLRIAERDGGVDAINAAKTALSENQAAWYKLYCGNIADMKQLFSEIGLTSGAIRVASRLK